MWTKTEILEALKDKNKVVFLDKCKIYDEYGNQFRLASEFPNGDNWKMNINKVDFSKVKIYQLVAK